MQLWSRAQDVCPKALNSNDSLLEVKSEWMAMVVQASMTLESAVGWAPGRLSGSTSSGRHPFYSLAKNEQHKTSRPRQDQT